VLAAGEPGSIADGPVAAAGGELFLGCQRWGSGRLGFLKRFGVTHVCASPAGRGAEGHWTEETCREAREAVEAEGMHVASMYLDVPFSVLVANDARDRTLARIRADIAAAGAAGIPALQYNLHHRTWNARTAGIPGRAGTSYSAWMLADATPAKKPSLAPITRDELWARITYVLEQIVPAATEAKVRLACHPPDPPIPEAGLFGMVQVMDTVDDLKRFVGICASNYHGLTFCQGTVCEMLANPKEEIFPIIRWFGDRKKIHGVHFRNIRGGRYNFAETFPDDGDIDMARAIRTYRDAGVTAMLMPDHVPGHPDDPEGLQSWAFAYGYIRGMIDATRPSPVSSPS
jgi:mannonate dehydratase